MGKYRAKRKARTQKKVSIHKKIKKIPKLKVADPKARLLWTHKQTLKKNYESIGISFGVNSDDAQKKVPKSIEEEEKLIELTEDPNFVEQNSQQNTEDLNITIPAEHLPHEARLSHAELATIAELIQKHGFNYKKMEMDIKVNRYQLTQKQLKKKVELYYCKYRDSKLDPLKGVDLNNLDKGVYNRDGESD